MTDIVTTFARALDDGDYDAALRCLDPRCRYTIAGEELTGPAAIVASYRSNGDWVAETLDAVSWESEIATTGENRATITFIDHLEHAGRTLTHRCRQHVTLGPSGLIDSIAHEDLPGEKEAVNLFFIETGIDRGTRKSVGKRGVPAGGEAPGKAATVAGGAESSDGTSRPQPPDLSEWLGSIDIYLLDQVLRGRIRPGMRILDAGTGGGRNMTWFLRSGYDVSAADLSPKTITRMRETAARLAPDLSPDNFRADGLRDLTFPAGSFDVVVCIAVLHFAADESDFDAMLDGVWRTLRPGGFFFARLASSIGIEDRVIPLGDRRYTLPDGSDRFLVDEAFLLGRTNRLGARLTDPIKTVNVQGQRCMTNWCLEKPR